MFKIFTRIIAFAFVFLSNKQIQAQYFQATATISGNSIIFKIKAINSAVTCGWSDIEFFIRNSTSSPDPNFSAAIISVNTTDFPGVSIPYNGINVQGNETGYNNYWLGVSFTATASRTYAVGQEYTVCTITLPGSPASLGLELVHNEAFVPTYLALTDQGGNDKSAPSGNKFYGPGATICSCPGSTPALNHILPFGIALPLELLDFQASRSGKRAAHLQWQTIAEKDFSGFEIERQDNDNWRWIGVKEATGDGLGQGTLYEFYDYNVATDLAYYRLKMINTDGSFEYSPIRHVRFDNDKSLLVYPNPAIDELLLQFGSDVEEGNLSIELINMAGQVVLVQNVAIVAGGSSVLSLKEHYIPSGHYFFKAVNASISFSQNVIIKSE